MFRTEAVTADNLDAAIALILDVFHANVASTFTPQGIAIFEKTSPTEQANGLAEGHIFLCAMKNSDMVGVLRIGNSGHLFVLFVHPAHQGCGIAGHFYAQE